MEKNHRECAGRLFLGRKGGCGVGDNDIRCRTNQFGRVCLHLIGIAPGKPILNLNVGLCPSELREPFPKHCHARRCYRIVLSECEQERDAPDPVGAAAPEPSPGIPPCCRTPQ
jgi:hypothetical protein